MKISMLVLTLLALLNVLPAHAELPSQVQSILQQQNTYQHQVLQNMYMQALNNSALSPQGAAAIQQAFGAAHITVDQALPAAVAAPVYVAPITPVQSFNVVLPVTIPSTTILPTDTIMMQLQAFH